MKQWEYKTLWPGKDALRSQEDQLNQFGQEGWELVGTMRETYIFKRPIENIITEKLIWQTSDDASLHINTIETGEADTSIIEEKDLVPEHGNDGC